MTNTSQHIKIVVLQIVIGAGIFYFLVHPFTMTFYEFEFSGTPFSFSKFQEIFSERFMKSYSFNVGIMGGLLTLFGAVLGLVSSLFWIQIKNKNILVTTQQRLLQRDIDQLIKNGESDLVEFKSSIRYDYNKKTTNRGLEKVIAKTIAGFMNAKGGKLLIGVDDDGIILGLEKDFLTLKHKNKDGYEREIFRIISVQLGREACFANHVSFYVIEEKDICVIDIEPSNEPTYVNESENTIFYLRTGNATYPLTVKEVVNYLETRKS